MRLESWKKLGNGMKPRFYGEWEGVWVEWLEWLVFYLIGPLGENIETFVVSLKRNFK